MQDAGLVADRVVLLVVDDIVERADLREFGRDRVQQGSALREILAETDDQHHCACVRVADEHVAQLAVVGADVVEAHAVLQAPVLDEEADGVGRLGLQVAALDVEHLVEELPDVEAQAGFAFHPGGDFLRRHPTLVGSGEFEFIAVVAGLVRTDDRAEFGHLEVADAGQLVIDLALLGGQLDLVGERLPAAAAADREMVAERFQTLLGRLHQLDDRPFHPGLLLADKTHVDDISRHGESDENHLSFRRMGNRFALRRDGFDDEILQYDVQFAVSWHSTVSKYQSKIVIILDIVLFAKGTLFAPGGVKS